ncbi:hypothetical protein LTR53_014486 [Teratosphaeriaceae sp. CCFEE 6253]|nr:hypothetical protein LTR53_014486 [Teratosphaeriaceae sp. CCFEE 6253]
MAAILAIEYPDTLKKLEFYLAAPLLREKKDKLKTTPTSRNARDRFVARTSLSDDAALRQAYDDL